MSKHTVTQVDDLVACGLVAESERAPLSQVANHHAVALTAEVQGMINPADLTRDPIARQFVPSTEELNGRECESADPIGDFPHSPVRGLVHRYPDRVLVKATAVCPVYCRFCFRKEMVGGNGPRPLSDEDLAAMVGYVRRHEQIWEVIFSGGDPLVLSPRRLRQIVQAFAEIDHVRILRFHTRVPLVKPSSVRPDLIDAMVHANATTYLVLHANHAREFTAEGRQACSDLARRGIPMRSQTVLLRGVNDSVEVLEELMRTFVENRVTPYYLHQLDSAPGTGHFQVPIEEGQGLMRALRGRVSGLCQPTYVLDIPGGFGKSPIDPCYWSATSEGVAVTDYQGNRHQLQDG